MIRKIYLASSWRNPHHAFALNFLQAAGHEVYDFKNPQPGLKGFSWRDTHPVPSELWGPAHLLQALAHPIAIRGFLADFSAMKWADTFVLLLPCGRSAHLEAGWGCAAGKAVHVVLHEDKFEPELMYLMADAVHCTVEDCAAVL